MCNDTLMAYDMPYFRAINLNTVSTEIIQGLSGSIGLILTVPITSMVSALFIANSKKGSSIIYNK